MYICMCMDQSCNYDDNINERMTEREKETYTIHMSKNCIKGIIMFSGSKRDVT